MNFFFTFAWKEMSLSLYCLLALCLVIALICRRQIHMTRCLVASSSRVSNIAPSPVIPKVIYMSTAIPLEKVPDLLKNWADGYEVCIYNDESCRSFLKHFWGEETLKRFDSMKKGAHKMDLWRYCMLYLHGGIYLDIKTVPTQKLDDIFVQHDMWYTCLSAMRGCYQGIIATPKGNDILLDCIRMVMETSNKQLASDYLLLTTQMHQTCQRIYNSRCDAPGAYVTCGDELRAPNLMLFQEQCSESECRFTRHDKYGLCCNIRDEHGTHIFRTRHGKYPWKRLPSGEKSILTRSDIKVIK